jgi:hypothetical protein
MRKYIGTIDLRKGKVDVTDPCYERGTWCAAYGIPLFPGMYHVYVNEVELDPWGKRIKSLQIRHINWRNDKRWAHNEQVISHQIGVDSGLCGIYISPKRNYDDAAWEDYCEMLNKMDYPHVFFDERGITVSSGIGDGVYHCSGKRDAAAGKFWELTVRFL